MSGILLRHSIQVHVILTGFHRPIYSVMARGRHALFAGIEVRSANMTPTRLKPTTRPSSASTTSCRASSRPFNKFTKCCGRDLIRKLARCTAASVKATMPTASCAMSSTATCSSSCLWFPSPGFATNSPTCQTCLPSCASGATRTWTRKCTSTYSAALRNLLTRRRTHHGSCPDRRMPRRQGLASFLGLPNETLM